MWIQVNASILKVYNRFALTNMDKPMKRSLRAGGLAFSLLLSHAAHGQAAAGQNIDLNSVEKVFSQEIDKLCNLPGATSNVALMCTVIKEPCKASPAPNTCAYVMLYRHSTLITQCGEEKFGECLKEDLEYKDRLSAFMSEKADSPGPGLSAFNLCEPFHRVTPVTVTEKHMDQTIRSALGTVALYENKSMFECMKEQWFKLLTDK